MEKERRVDIKAVEFDWLFGTSYGDQFMKNVAESDNMELFKLQIIKAFILFQWKYFRTSIILYSLAF